MEETVSALATRNVSEADLAASIGQFPLVSVIIPCFNGEAFLQETIASAMAQSYPRVEVLVVDDGSTDRSPEIAQAMPVRYVRQTHRGLAITRNLGIRESRGSYIVFLDADDRLRPDAIETGLRVLAQHPDCAMAVGDHLFVSEDGSYLAGSRKQCLLAAHYQALLKSNFIEMISSVLFRKSVLEQVGGFDTSLRVAEDYELYLRIARGYPLCCHPAVIAEYRLHESNTSHNAELMLAKTLLVLRMQARYILREVRLLPSYLQGMRTWRRQYGRQLASELAHNFSSLSFGQRVRKLWMLLNAYPQGLLMILVLRILANVAGGNTPARRATDKTPRLQQMHAWLNASKPSSKSQAG